MRKIITRSANGTKKAGAALAKKIKGGGIIALEGNLGSGKTTFAQGLLKGLGVKGPYTSPTFLVMKQYELKARGQKLKAVFHIDVYRIKSKDLLNLGWKELIEDKNNVIIIEWADRVKKIIPRNALWIRFEWQGKNNRKIEFL